MSRRVASLWIVPFLTGWVVCAAGQKSPAATMNELSAVLATSCANQPTLTLAADGTIVRKDKNGATMTFKLRDIGAIAIDAPTPAKMVVFSVSPPAVGEQVAKMFKDLQAALTPAARK
jgi:hypothetical protein